MQRSTGINSRVCVASRRDGFGAGEENRREFAGTLGPGRGTIQGCDEALEMDAIVDFTAVVVVLR